MVIGHSAWNKGLTKETDIRLQKTSDTYHQRYNEGKYTSYSHPHSKETKELLSKLRSEYLSKAENVGGFKDVGWYKIKNIENTEFIVRGLWEYNVAKKLNELNILWIKNQYVHYFIKDVQKIYNPDFYIPSINEYIEVKGYFSEKDKNKMNAVINQNPQIKIRFMQYQSYKDFIENKCSIKDVSFYKESLL